MNDTASNETSLKLAGSFALENTQKNLEVTQPKSSIVHEFAKLNIEKATNKFDRKALNVYNVFVKLS